MVEAAAAAERKLKQEQYYKYNSARGLAADSCRRGDYENAVRFYTEAIEFAEEGCELPLILARSKCHCKRGDHAAARADALHLTEAAPDDVNVMANDAYTLYAQNEFCDAMVRNVVGYQTHKRPDTFDVGQKVCSAVIKQCLGEPAGPIMREDRLGRTIVNMSTKSKPVRMLDEEQKHALCKRTTNMKDKFLAEKYLRKTANDKEFLKSCLNNPNIYGADKDNVKQLLDIIQEAIKSVEAKQEHVSRNTVFSKHVPNKEKKYLEETLMARHPMYCWKNQEPVLSKKREDQIEVEKSRFKKGAMSVVFKLNKKLRSAFEANDLNKSFTLAFRIERYIDSHCKQFLTQQECQLFFDSLYNIIGEFYFCTKALDNDMSGDKNDQRIHCILGAELPDWRFIQDVRRSLMPHVVDKRTYSRGIEKKLEVAVPSLERTFLYHELAMCLSSGKQAEMSMKAAQKGFDYAKAIGHKIWCTNNAFLIARATYLQGDLEDAREFLATTLDHVIEMERTRCADFLEKVIGVIEREESQPFDPVPSAKKHQRQIVNLMANLDMKLQAESLFRKIEALPVTQRFRILPKTEEKSEDRKASRKVLRLITPLKRKVVNSIRGTNACEGPRYCDDARATFVV